MTGEVRFDQYGLRTGFNLDVMELKKYGLTKVVFLFESDL